MPRLTHTPTLYPHAEHDDDDDDDDWIGQYSTPPPLPSTSSQPNGRSRPRAKKSTSSPSYYSSIQSSSNTYSQFLRRYRSSDHTDPDDPRNDPDSHYFNIGLGQLQDAGDSDDEELPRAALAGSDSLAGLLDSDPSQPHSDKDLERLSWKAQLASVLSGDVLKSERARIAVALENSGDEKNTMQLNFWYGIRAKFHGVSEEEERKNLEERRIRLVDPVIDDILNFRVNSADENDITSALQQVTSVLQRLEYAQALYPSLKHFYHDKPRALEGPFEARCDALNTWSTVILTLQHQLAVLKRWTGSETLDVTKPNTSAEAPISTGYNRRDGHTEISDGTSFVERVLKEESMQRMFEKGSLMTNHAYIGAARDAQVNLGSFFQEMALPTFEKQLSPLIAFPTKLAQAALRVRLGYVQKIQDPDVLIIDQMTEDLKISIGLACTLRRQYEAFLAPDPEGKWNVPQCIDDDYDATIMDAMKHFFRLIHWKLKSGAKGIYFKETDFLEAQWATMNDVAMTISGSSSLIAEQLWYVIHCLAMHSAHIYQLVDESVNDTSHQLF
jgi:mitogen-activated protein kinase kinase kinase